MEMYRHCKQTLCARAEKMKMLVPNQKIQLTLEYPESAPAIAAGNHFVGITLHGQKLTLSRG